MGPPNTNTAADPPGCCELRLQALLWQPIFDRRGGLHGYESLARLHGQLDTGSAIASATPLQLWEITGEMLAKVCGAAHQRGLSHFVNLEKSTLADPRSVELLLEARRWLAQHDCRLVVEITERPLAVAALRPQYLEQLRRLHRHGIALALDDCPLPLPGDAVELAERLCRYVKIDLRQAGVPVRPGPEAAAAHAHLAGMLQAGIQHYGIALVAEVIETRWQHDYALSLPFDYFQGYHLQRPQPI